METPETPAGLRLALVAHDAKKDVMVDWAHRHAERMLGARLFATGTTGSRILATLPELDLTCLKSGPLGGDQQLGAMICEGRLDGLIFFIDPMSPMPHDVDVKALSRLAIVYDLPFANSPSTADYVLRGMVGGGVNGPAKTLSQPKKLYRASHTAKGLGAEGLQGEISRVGGDGVGGERHLSQVLAGALDPAGAVDRAAHDGEVEPVRAADIAQRHLSVIQPDHELQEGQGLTRLAPWRASQRARPSWRARRRCRPARGRRPLRTWRARRRP